MKAILHWSEDAREDLFEIFLTIARDNPAAAERVYNALEDRYQPRPFGLGWYIVRALALRVGAGCAVVAHRSQYGVFPFGKLRVEDDGEEQARASAAADSRSDDRKKSNSKGKQQVSPLRVTKTGA